ncbi:hypothetical protein SynA1560_02571 [Synechococcus sp. A15-60]|nr:hypothetical protein SynA1560_02571 [Synechococcus sp. A15-60]
MINCFEEDLKRSGLPLRSDVFGSEFDCEMRDEQCAEWL